MKNIINKFTVGIALALSFVACHDDLDQTPIDPDSFTEEDVDGSEVITHIEIILPDGVNIEVIHPNGAYPDGSGRWIIPIDAGTDCLIKSLLIGSVPKSADIFPFI